MKGEKLCREEMEPGPGAKAVAPVKARVAAAPRARVALWVGENRDRVLVEVKTVEEALGLIETDNKFSWKGE